MSNDWAFKMLSNLGPQFYGEVTFKVRAGEIIRVMKAETFVAPNDSAVIESIDANGTRMVAEAQSNGLKRSQR